MTDIDTSAKACAIACMLVSNPNGEMQHTGWQKRVNDLIRALRAERDTAEARVERLEAALHKLVSASSRLAVAAQTSCGVAGRDEGLCAEIDRIAQPIGEARAVLAQKETDHE